MKIFIKPMRKDNKCHVSYRFEYRTINKLVPIDVVKNLANAYPLAELLGSTELVNK